MNLKITDQTNTDYKIKAFIFARKLQTFISKQIGNEQTAYKKTDTPFCILDIFEY